MLYRKRNDLLRLKRIAGWTYREVAEILNCSPSTAASKLCGFCALTDREEMALYRALNDTANSPNDLSPSEMRRGAQSTVIIMCKKCGAKIGRNDHFCSNCGRHHPVTN